MPLNFPDNPIDGQTHEESQQRWVFRASPASWYVDPTYVYQPPTSPEAPVIADRPVIDNTSPTVGDTLTATPSSVTGNPTPSRTWQWFRDATPVGTNSPNYTTVLADEGSVITVRQTETNSEGSDSATSLGTDAVVHVAPVAAGNLMDQTYTNNTGNQVYDTSGDFTGEALVYSLQTSTVGVTINSSTGVVTFDTNTLGLQVGTSVVVRATNSGGFADSGFSFTISDSLSAPVITGKPVINDTSPTVGQTLTASPASVTGNPTPTRTWQWQLNNVNISGATNITYTVALGDEGGQLSVVQIETNSEGTANSESDPTSAVVHIAPTAGGALQDQTFEQNTGNQTYSTAFDFTGADLVYSLQTSTAGVTINSGTGVVTFDTNTLGIQTGTSVVVRATNSGGFVDSGFSFTITEQLTVPVITSPPTIDDTTPTVGQTLNATPGPVTGNPTPTTSWQWKKDSVDIPSATSQSYQVQVADIGGLLSVVQTETNSQGSDSEESAQTSAVVAVAAVLSGAQASANGPNGATGLQVTTDQPADGTPGWGGTLYWGIYPTASNPSAGDIKAGTGATVFDNQAISAGATQIVADQTGLAAETAYKTHYVQENGSGLDSNVDTSLEFTTQPDVWDPNLPTGTVAWWDAGDPANYTESGGEYATLTDLTGNGNTMSVPSANGPLVATNVRNGLNAMDIPGTSVNNFMQRLGLSLSGFGGDFIVGIACQPRSAGVSLQACIVSYFTTPGNSWQFDAFDSNDFLGRINSGVITNIEASPTMDDGQWRYVTIVFDFGANRATLYDNGVNVGQATDYNTSMDDLGDFKIGANRGGTSVVDAHVGEVVVSTNLTIRADLENYLSTRWAI